MKRKTPFVLIICHSVIGGRFRIPRVAWGLSLILLPHIPAQALEYLDFTYTSNGSEITITDYNGPGGAITIPSMIDDLPVTAIGSSAFRDCTVLGSVEIPDSLRSIGSYAFRGCTSLATATIGNAVQSIGDYAFYGCSQLASVTIPDSVTYLGTQAFYHCIRLASVTIGSGVSTFGSYAFAGCTGLVSATIRSGVASIGSYAFAGCAALGIVDIPASVQSIGAHAFRGCTSLATATIGNAVQSIGDYAFKECSQLASVTIPDSVTYLGTQAFYHCIGLGSVTIGSGVSTFGSEAFSGSSSLVTVTIRGGVTSIGHYGFYGCTALENVEIPDSVQSIGGYAFRGCTGLTSVVIGSGVNNIGGYAFYGCSNLIGIYFLGNAPALGSQVFTGDDNATIYYLPGTTGWTNPWGGRPTAPWVYTLTVNSAGASGVTISSTTEHGGITNYSRSVAHGASVMLTAPATSNSLVFTRWFGDAASYNQTVSFTLTGPKTVTAEFAEPELLLAVPNGGEAWGCGTTQAITWDNPSGDAGPTVRLGLEKAGAFVGWIVRQTENDGAYNWVVWTDIEPGDNYTIRVQSYTNSSYRDMGDAPFSIQALGVKVPNGGEVWTMGDVETVTWGSHDTAAGTEVRIGLHYGLDLLAWINRRTENDGRYAWKVPTDLDPGIGYRVRVQSYTDSAIRDLSDTPFTLVAPPLVWTYPDFQDVLTWGATYDIAWDCNSLGAVGPDVRIGLHKGGAFIDWIRKTTPNDGVFSWTVGARLGVLEPAPSYRLRVQSLTDKNLRAMSPAFSIAAP